MASARRTCSSPGGLAMADDDDLGLLGIDTFEAFQGLDFEEDEHSSQSSVLRASSTRLPRCAVLNFQRVGDCVSMRPRAFTDTGTFLLTLCTKQHLSGRKTYPAVLLHVYVLRVLTFSCRPFHHSFFGFIWIPLHM